MLQKQLYRSLLRVTKTLDSKPASKTLIYRNQRESFNNGMENDNDLAGDYYIDLLGDLFHNAHFMDPNRCHISLESMLKREYRGLGIGKNVNPSIRLDVGLYCLKKASMLSSTIRKIESTKRIPGINETSSSSSSSSSSSLAENMKSKLINNVESGILLVSHPMMEGPFQRSVIMILDHSDKGSYGLVINKASDYDLESSVRNFPKELVKTFGKKPVQYGGPVRRLQYIHSIKDLEGATPILNCDNIPLYYGGKHEDATLMVEENPELLSKFQFFAGCCTWRPGQLQDELDSGCWFAFQGNKYDELLSTTRNASKDYLDYVHSHSSISSTDTGINMNREKEVDFINENVHNKDNNNIISDEEVENIKEMLDNSSIASAVETATDDFNSFDSHHDDHAMDLGGVWPLMCQSLGGPYKDLAWLPRWVDSTVIEPCDWKH